MIKTLRYLLWPVSVLYGLVIWFRNLAYDKGLFKSQSANIPVIVVGNLAVGGAGKSPMTEYLIRLLKNKLNLATLSRGYGRETKGFRYVQLDDEVSGVGDEPLQFKRKYPDVTVAVCEDRVKGISELQHEHEVVILDDAYQHRALKPGFSILLFDYNSLFKPRLMLPTGDFRDTFDQRKRADVIIVSKVPEVLSTQDKVRVKSRLNVSANIPVLFSFLTYGHPYPLSTFEVSAENSAQRIERFHSVLLLTGIANPAPLVTFVNAKVKHTQLLEFPDHHQFTKKDMEKLRDQFEGMKDANKVIITTEKDAQRLKSASLATLIQSLPIFVLPIETTFNKVDEDRLSAKLFSYLSLFGNFTSSTH